MTETRTGAEYLAEAFEAYGVTDIFFMEAILRRGLREIEKHDVRRVMAHSEKAAAYMADGYARASGKVGVCMAQSVGAANLAAGLQDAYLARSPIVALTGHKAIPQLHRNAYQEIAHPPMFQSVTRFSANVEEASQLPFLLRQAFREATGPTPRPAHLDFAGLSGEVIDTGIISGPVEADPRHGRAPAYRTAPDPTDIAAAAELIAAAERPVAVLGGGAVLAGAGAEASALAALGVPIAYGLDGKGLVSDTDETTIGPVGTYSAPHANRIVHEADLVIFVGSDTSDQITMNWQLPAPGARVVQIDADHAELGRNHPGALGICADAKLALQALLAHLPAREDRGWVARVRAQRGEWEAAVETRAAAAGKPTTVERLCRELTAALPADAMLVADTGFSGIWTGTLVALNGLGQGYLRAAGSLGWGFPAALGAQCALRDRPVVCFCGDGAFYYHLPELETARRWGIPVTVVVNNNSAFGQDIAGVRQAYEGHNGRAEDLTHFEPVNFARVADAFGCKGMRIDDPADLADALEAAIGAEEPTVIDVATDPENRAPSAWAPPQGE
jgi:acetolactate synthase-1/2/3 large subunit